jgi:hypothetical protein
MPLEIQDCMDKFSAYYLSIPGFDRRKINWNMNYGTALVHFKTDKIYRMTVSSRQICMLYIFNSKTIVKYEEFMMTLSATLEELKPHLISLLRMKVILSKDKELKESTSFKFNQKFTSQKIAFTLPIPTIKEDPIKL